MTASIKRFFNQSCATFKSLPKSHKIAICTGSSLVTLYLGLEAFDTLNYWSELSSQKDFSSLKRTANSNYKNEKQTNSPSKSYRGIAFLSRFYFSKKIEEASEKASTELISHKQNLDLLIPPLKESIQCLRADIVPLLTSLETAVKEKKHQEALDLIKRLEAYQDQLQNYFKQLSSIKKLLPEFSFDNSSPREVLEKDLQRAFKTYLTDVKFDSLVQAMAFIRKQKDKNFNLLKDEIQRALKLAEDLNDPIKITLIRRNLEPSEYLDVLISSVEGETQLIAWVRSFQRALDNKNFSKAIEAAASIKKHQLFDKVKKYLTALNPRSTSVADCVALHQDFIQTLESPPDDCVKEALFYLHQHSLWDDNALEKFAEAAEEKHLKSKEFKRKKSIFSEYYERRELVDARMIESHELYKDNQKEAFLDLFRKALCWQTLEDGFPDNIPVKEDAFIAFFTSPYPKALGDLPYELANSFKAKWPDYKDLNLDFFTTPTLPSELFNKHDSLISIVAAFSYWAVQRYRFISLSNAPKITMVNKTDVGNFLDFCIKKDLPILLSDNTEFKTLNPEWQDLDIGPYSIVKAAVIRITDYCKKKSINCPVEENALVRLTNYLVENKILPKYFYGIYTETFISSWSKEFIDGFVTQSFQEKTVLPCDLENLQATLEDPYRDLTLTEAVFNYYIEKIVEEVLPLISNDLVKSPDDLGNELLRLQNDNVLPSFNYELCKSGIEEKLFPKLTTPQKQFPGSTPPHSKSTKKTPLLDQFKGFFYSPTSSKT